MPIRTLVVCASLVFSLGAAQPVSALTLTLSDASSEPATNPPEDLFADITFAVSACGASNCTLTVTLENRTDESASGVTYDINEIGFNAVFAIVNSPDLTYVSATENGLTDRTAAWTFFEQTGNPDQNTHLGGFGIFDFALRDGVGVNPGQANPGDSIAFVFLAPAGISDSDFLQLSEPRGGQPLKFAAAKFVEGDPAGSSDSAFGSTAVPEPAAFALLGVGLVWLAFLGRLGRREP